jgi:hypothetical protein
MERSEGVETGEKKLRRREMGRVKRGDEG